MQKEKTFNLLMVIPDDSTMEGFKAPTTAKDVRKTYKGWSPGERPASSSKSVN